MDDEPDLAQLFTEALKAVDLNAIGLDNPVTALEYIDNSHGTICLVVTDWRISDIDGPDLTSQVVEIGNELGVMLMSTYELDQDQLKEG